nr:MAG: hypothetical protein [Bacteriophage sp.]
MLSSSGNVPEMFPHRSLSAQIRRIQVSAYLCLPAPGQNLHLRRPEAQSHPEAVLSAPDP